MSDLERVRLKELRLVLNAKRAKHLRKRGEAIRWSTELSGWVWVTQ